MDVGHGTFHRVHALHERSSVRPLVQGALHVLMPPLPDAELVLFGKRWLRRLRHFLLFLLLAAASATPHATCEEPAACSEARLGRSSGHDHCFRLPRLSCFLQLRRLEKLPLQGRGLATAPHQAPPDYPVQEGHIRLEALPHLVDASSHPLGDIFLAQASVLKEKLLIGANAHFSPCVLIHEPERSRHKRGHEARHRIDHRPLEAFWVVRLAYTIHRRSPGHGRGPTKGHQHSRAGTLLLGPGNLLL
mmetsp:Transcript_58787/g.126336  ORF Transcript_58787/g.126336 Transcript_58787/m.126336 type:complete len:247 (+) Transcript_58787:319-1059(+)